MPLLHKNGNRGEDIIHWRWASAIMSSLYLGSIMEQKRSHGGFEQQQIDLMRDSIEYAFKIGVEDAKHREARRSRLP